MHLSRNDIPVQLEAPGAVARQLTGFGVADAALGVEYFSMAAGTDLAPLLQGLEDDHCQAEHWGYLISGEVVVTYTDRSTERVGDGEVFHWPSGHSVRVERDAEVIMFSPQDAHGAVIEHIRGRLAALSAG
jgi:hypothetical protein